MQLRQSRIQIGTPRAQRKPYRNVHDPLLLQIQEEYAPAQRRADRIAVVLTALLHVAIFVMVFPKGTDRIRDARSEPRLFRVQEVRFVPPEPPRPRHPEQVTAPRVRRVPVPDPTPLEPEPLMLEEASEPTEPDFPAVGPVVSIPDAPPSPGLAPLEIEGDVVAPVRLHAPQPAYPEEARQARIQGVVILQTVIDTLGNVTDVRVLKGLPSGLTDAAIQAVTQWKFRPALLEEQPVPVYYLVTVSFSLQ